MPINELGEHVENDERTPSPFEGGEAADEHEVERGVIYPTHLERLEEIVYNNDAVRAHRQLHEQNNPMYRAGIV